MDKRDTHQVEPSSTADRKDAQDFGEQEVDQVRQVGTAGPQEEGVHAR